MKDHKNVTVSIFAHAAMGERSQISNNAIGIFTVDQGMRGHLRAQERIDAPIKSVVQLTQ